MSWSTILFWVFGGSLAVVAVWFYLTRRSTDEAADRVLAVLSWQPQTLDELMGALNGDGSIQDEISLATFHMATEVLINEGWAKKQVPTRTGERLTWSRARGGKRGKQGAAS